MGKSLGNDAQAQQAFNKLKQKVQKALKDLINAYEKRLREKSAQIKRKNKKILQLKIKFQIFLKYISRGFQEFLTSGDKIWTVSKKI